MEAKKIRPSEGILKVGRQMDANFSLNEPKTRQIYQNLFYYFAGNTEMSKYNLKKGVLLTGDKGVGKTMVFKIMNRIFRKFKNSRCKEDIFRLFEETEKRYKVMEMYGYQFRQDLYIEDLGTENAVMKLFTNEVTLLGDLIMERYNLFIESGILTHFCTNLDAESLEQMYGPRVFDRLQQMCNIITWEGNSKR